MIIEDHMTSEASQEIEQRIEPKMQKESRPELRNAEETTLSTTTGSSGSGNRRSGRASKTIEFDPSPGPRTQRKNTCPGVSSVLKTLMKSGTSIVKTMK